MYQYSLLSSSIVSNGEKMHVESRAYVDSGPSVMKYYLKKKISKEREVCPFNVIHGRCITGRLKDYLVLGVKTTVFDLLFTNNQGPESVTLQINVYAMYAMYL